MTDDINTDRAQLSTLSRADVRAAFVEEMDTPPATSPPTPNPKPSPQPSPAPAIYTTAVLYSGRTPRTTTPLMRHGDPNKAHTYASTLARNEHIVAVFRGDETTPVGVWIFGQEYVQR